MSVCCFYWRIILNHTNCPFCQAKIILMYVLMFLFVPMCYFLCQCHDHARFICPSPFNTLIFFIVIVFSFFLFCSFFFMTPHLTIKYINYKSPLVSLSISYSTILSCNSCRVEHGYLTWLAGRGSDEKFWVVFSQVHLHGAFKLF